jgi:hypothetical protein
VFDQTVVSISMQMGHLGTDYRSVWRDSLTSPSGQHLNVRVPTTDPTLDTYVNNESTRNALSEAYRKMVEADALLRSVRGLISSRREQFDPKQRHAAEGVSLSEQEMSEMSARAKAKPSQKWQRTA